MKKNSNVFILNDNNLEIGKIVLDNADLKIFDKSFKYCFRVVLFYNWQDILNVKMGEKKQIDFNEYILSENDEPALIIPSESYVEKINDKELCFYFNFKKKAQNICYMNERNRFDIMLNSLEARVFIDFKDAKDGFIIYD